MKTTIAEHEHKVGENDTQRLVRLVAETEGLPTVAHELIERRDYKGAMMALRLLELRQNADSLQDNLCRRFGR